MKTIRRLSIFVILIMTVYMHLYADAGEDLFKKARSKTISRKWNLAINLYERFIHEYPEHPNQDDAFFWLAYCTEKKVNGDVQAFLLFAELIHAYPQSAWCDDAVIHQIGIAGRQVERGESHFLNFIKGMLTHSDSNVRNQAAVTLGKLGDASAIPVLGEMQKEQDYRMLSKSLIQGIEEGGGARTKVQAPRAADREYTMGAGIEKMGSNMKKAEKSIEPREAEPGWKQNKELPTDYSLRSVQYRSMLKINKEWSPGELEDYGMWAILSTNAFEEYRRLTGYDRKEWLRKYWQKMDPLPATPENEAYQEFRSRVKYAYENFSDNWDYRQLIYMQDQYQRKGWPNAPWDARGDLWVKYGKPDRRTAEGWHGEVWQYYQYHSDFVVQKYVTNLTLSGYRAGPVSSHFYPKETMISGNPASVDADPVHDSEFRFEPEENIKHLQPVESRIKLSDGTLVLDYTLPVHELGYCSHQDSLRFDIDFVSVVFNEDYREVFRDSVAYTFNRADEREIKRYHKQPGRIRMVIPPDAYRLVILVRDRHSDKIEMLVQDLAKD